MACSRRSDAGQRTIAACCRRVNAGINISGAVCGYYNISETISDDGDNTAGTQNIQTVGGKLERSQISSSTRENVCEVYRVESLVR